VNDFVRPESMEVPDGGLATFLTATVGDWADDDEGYIPQSGIGGVKSVADKLAEYGRYEDTYMVHAAEGETVIPMAVFDENPRLKETLFNQMRAMGIDPEQYVVGSELNSINPVTGQPEFFLKKLFRGLKKAVKKVVKVIKKVAPIALSIGLSFTPLGAIAGTALGSGIGTLIQGGSLKDALKMGAIGGLTAGLFKGVTGGIGSKMQGGTFGGGFKAGIQSGLPDAMRASQAAALNQTAAQAANQALPPPPSSPAGSTTVTGATNAQVANLPGADTAQKLARPAPIDQVRPDMQMTVTAPKPTVMTPQAGDLFADAKPGFLPQNVNPVGGGVGGTPAAAGQVAPDVPAGGISDTRVAADPSYDFNFAEDSAKRFAPQPVKRTPGFFRSVKDMFVDVGPGDKGFFQAGKDAFFPSSFSPEEIMRAELGLPPEASVGQVMQKAATTEGLQRMSYQDLLASLGKAEGYNPSFLRRFGPAAGAGLGILGLTGGFEGEDIPVPEDPFGLEGQSSFDLLAADPQKYRVFYAGGPYNLGGKPYGAAAGGSTDDFPRRDGAIAGPGTGTSDDIPAMLSDGEFVMTAQAVRGAGNGDRKKGVRKMYEIMRTYEGVA
jgi:hypothetical protein